MSSNDLNALPLPEFAGGRGLITTTPVVGDPRREYADAFVPGKEELEDGELRVTVLGSGNPFVTRAQASGSILVEAGTRIVICSCSISGPGRWRTSQV